MLAPSSEFLTERRMLRWPTVLTLIPFLECFCTCRVRDGGGLKPNLVASEDSSKGGKPCFVLREFVKLICLRLWPSLTALLPALVLTMELSTRLLCAGRAVLLRACVALYITGLSMEKACTLCTWGSYFLRGLGDSYPLINEKARMSVFLVIVFARRWGESGSCSPL